MPRSILLRPPGGASGKVHKWYALSKKLALLDESTRLQRDCNLSLRRAAEVIGVPVQVLSRWQKEVPTIHAAIADQPQTRNKKAILDGPKGTLGSVEMGGDNGNDDAYDDSLFDSDEEVEESDGGDEEESDGGEH